MSFEYDTFVNVYCDNDGCDETEYGASVSLESEHRDMARFYRWHYDDDKDKVYCPACCVKLGLRPGIASDLDVLEERARHA